MASLCPQGPGTFQKHLSLKRPTTRSLIPSSTVSGKCRVTASVQVPRHASSSAVRRPQVKCQATSATESDVAVKQGPTETVFFDGGTHWGDFVVNFLAGFTGIWLPLTLTSLFRTLYLRYRFTDRRFTILSGLSDSDRRDYPYSVVSEVRSLPRFIGEWGDITIILKDKTVIDLKSVPKFREVAKYVEERAEATKTVEKVGGSGSSAKGFE